MRRGMKDGKRTPKLTKADITHLLEAEVLLRLLSVYTKDRALERVADNLSHIDGNCDEEGFYCPAREVAHGET